jgi:hypothetical protein
MYFDHHISKVLSIQVQDIVLCTDRLDTTPLKAT